MPQIALAGAEFAPWAQATGARFESRTAYAVQFRCLHLISLAANLRTRAAIEAHL